MTLLVDILAFCDQHGMSVSQFGRRAVNSSALVHKLRAGAIAGPSIVARCRNFIDATDKAGSPPPIGMSVIDARRATLPSMPRGRCGARGWCEHRPEPVA